MSEVELKMARRAQDPVFEGARSAKNETLELSLDARMGFYFFAREKFSRILQQISLTNY